MTETDPLRPFANSPTARLISEQIEKLQLTKSQREIAAEIGFAQPNIVSMIKRGETKMPLDRTDAFAKALNVDPRRLFRMALNDYFPSLAEMFNEIFGDLATKNERDLFISPWRLATHNQDPVPSERCKIEFQMALIKLATRESFA